MSGRTGGREAAGCDGSPRAHPSAVPTRRGEEHRSKPERGAVVRAVAARRLAERLRVALDLLTLLLEELDLLIHVRKAVLFGLVGRALGAFGEYVVLAVCTLDDDPLVWDSATAGEEHHRGGDSHRAHRLGRGGPCDAGQADAAAAAKLRFVGHGRSSRSVM
ncbi:hypothetical protein ACFPRL_32310 [Pseudoclavibacter helvolus]